MISEDGQATETAQTTETAPAQIAEWDPDMRFGLARAERRFLLARIARLEALVQVWRAQAMGLTVKIMEDSVSSAQMAQDEAEVNRLASEAAKALELPESAILDPLEGHWRLP